MEKTSERVLIVNADDFGQTDGVNRGIIESHEKGIVTSASLMVRGAAAADAANYARRHPSLSVGLHFDLGEWTKLNGAWQPRYEVVRLDDSDAVRTEMQRQLESFRKLMGHDPSHLDSHQHIHREGNPRIVAAELAKTLNVPLRHFDAHVRYCGDFYGQPWQGQSMVESVGVAALIRLLHALQPGITEVACHPAYPEGLESDYREERVLEVRTLCDPAARATIDDEGIRLCSFTQLNGCA